MDAMSKPFKAKVVAELSQWFINHELTQLERRFLNRGAAGLEALEARFVSIINGIANEEAFSEDKRRFLYTDWVIEMAKSAIYNPVQVLWEVVNRQHTVEGRQSPRLDELKVKFDKKSSLVED